MLIEYVQAAMRKAVYELLADDEGFFGRIPECRGVWANASTLEACREELQSVLQDWIVIKLRHNDNDFLAIDGVDINPILAGNENID